MQETIAAFFNIQVAPFLQVQIPLFQSSVEIKELYNSIANMKNGGGQLGWMNLLQMV